MATLKDIDPANIKSPCCGASVLMVKRRKNDVGYDCDECGSNLDEAIQLMKARIAMP